MTQTPDDRDVSFDVASARRAPAPFEQSTPPRRERTMAEQIRRLSRAGVERPGAVTAAVVLLWLLVGVGCVGLFVAASLIGDAAMAAPMLWIVLGVGAVLLAMEAVIVAFVARGARWARVVLTVLVVARLLLALLGGVGPRCQRAPVDRRARAALPASLERVVRGGWAMNDEPGDEPRPSGTGRGRHVRARTSRTQGPAAAHAAGLASRHDHA